ncbi:MAG: recombination mediator RecR [Victivallaceae bacterium]
MSKYPPSLSKIILTLKQLPGIGFKMAERLAFDLLSWPKEKLQNITTVLESIPDHFDNCFDCGMLIEKKTDCSYCNSQTRDSSVMCIVAYPRDVFSIESSGTFKGIYYVLGSLFSPASGKKPIPGRIIKLREKISTIKTKEIVIAMDFTLEGDTTALYLKKELGDLGINITRLATGLPMGLSLDYIDSRTLAKAFSGRNVY